MSPEESLVLVFFGKGKPERATEALAIDLQTDHAPACLVFGKELQRCLDNGHRKIQVKKGEGRYGIMDKIYGGLEKSEIDEYVNDPNPTKYSMLKQVYEALGDMLIGDGDGNKSRP